MMNLNKMWSVFAAALLLVTSAASAAYNGYSSSQDCCPFLCPARPVCNPCGNWFVSADLLVWSACEDGLGFGVRATGTTTEDIFEEKEKNLSEKWNAGFRVGLGYNMPCDGWDITGYWTHIEGHRKGSETSDFITDSDGEITVFFPSWIEVPFIPDGVNADWKLRLDVIDLELGREFYISKCLTLRPFIGVRAARIDQKFDVEAFSDRNLQTFNLETEMKNDYCGVGLRAGMDSEWSFGCGWSIYGQAAVSLLYGHFNLKREHFEIDPADDTAFSSPSDDEFVTELSHKSDHHNACRAITDLGVGVRWKQYFDCDCMALTLQLGWEQHMFFGQNYFQDVLAEQSFLTNPINPSTDLITNTSRVATQYNRGDLCVQGVTLSAKLDF